VNIRDVAVGSALIEFDPSRVSEDQILNAVREAGYPAHAEAA
jgi:copper chaperone CopZ